ncbi:MAG: hypothetical protein FJ357_00910 [Thaumarchaeota archaeon]|nr:hypothetical protein [Nitrososphaerota archaeon]
MEKQPYQIQMQDYPKLFRYKITQQGIYHIEDLVSQIYLEEQTPSMYALVKLGILLRVNMCQTQNLQNESLFQDVSRQAKKFGGVEPQYIHECVKSLIARGLLESNPKYDRSLAMRLHLPRLNSV